MSTLSNTQSIRDIRGVQRNDWRSYDNLRKGDEDAAWDAYRAAEHRVRELRAAGIDGPELAQAKAESKARYKEWRDLVDSE